MDSKLTTLTVVRRTYVVDKEADSAKIDREFDAYHREAYDVICEGTCRAESSVRSLVLDVLSWNLSWDADVEELRIYKEGYFKTVLDKDTIAKDVEGEIHVWLVKPFYVTVQQSPVASRRPSTGYDMMMTNDVDT